jgi:hypothetical protein
MRISNYNRVRVFSHPQSTTPYGFSVGHLDDFLAGVIARHLGWSFYRLPQTDEQYVRARWGEIPSYVLHIVCDFPLPAQEGEDNVVVFDHHDEGGGKCSVHRFVEWLVEQGAYPCVPALMDEISAWDVKGPQAVPPAHRPDPDQLIALLSLETQDAIGLVEWAPEDVYAILWALHSASSIKEFVELVFSTNSIGPGIKLQLEVIQRLKEEALEKLVAGVKTQTSLTGVKYATLRTAPAGMTGEVFARLGVDVLIYPNERTEGAVSVVRDSSGQLKDTPVSELVDVAEGDLLFRHPGGFMIVARPPVTVK